jgi:hypothetical protein
MSHDRGERVVRRLPRPAGRSCCSPCSNEETFRDGLSSGAFDGMAANRRRHPSSAIEGVPPRAQSCPTCGFVPPTRREIPGALRALFTEWQRAIDCGDPALIEGAARLRDELHAIANRVARVLTAPGASVSRVRIHAPTALAGASDRGLVLVLLGSSADRLADITDTMDPDQWELFGCVGSSFVTIAELVLMPLHASHRRLSLPPTPLHASPITLHDRRRQDRAWSHLARRRSRQSAEGANSSNQPRLP